MLKEKQISSFGKAFLSAKRFDQTFLKFDRKDL
nr:hypothetical protein BSM_27240 [uncultured archaeon]